MKPTNASAPAAAAVAEGFRRWNTPVPYLFLGIAAMLGLIALALIMLACSNCKSSSSANSSSSGGEAKESSVKPMNAPSDAEPKIVVIMAGEDKPTFLAKPAPATDACQQV